MAEIKDIMIGLRAEDYIDLPERIFNPIYVKLPPKVMQQYRDFEETLVAEDYSVEAVNRGVLTNKLLQFCNGGLYRDIEGTFPVQKEVLEVHEKKLDMLEHILAEAGDKPVLVAYTFQFDLAKLKKRFPQGVVFRENRRTFQDDWNAGKIKLGFTHPASIGHGLNLQYGGHIQVWFGLVWSYETFDQFNWRLARPGQESPCTFVHMIMAEGTADEDVYDAMLRKGADQRAVTEAVRVRLGHSGYRSNPDDDIEEPEDDMHLGTEEPAVRIAQRVPKKRSPRTIEVEFKRL